MSDSNARARFRPRAVPVREEAPVRSVTSGEESTTLRIDCDECVLQGSDACRDCIVSFICGVETGEPVVVRLAEARAMRLLGEAGLAPPLRHSSAR